LTKYKILRTIFISNRHPSSAHKLRGWLRGFKSDIFEAMNKNVEALLNRVRNWSQERQEDVVELVKLIEEHDRSPYRLTEEQAAEVRRRLVNDKHEPLTLAQLDDRLHLLGI
jgi:hypothetical protein